MKSIVLRVMLALAAFTVVPNALAADTASGNFFLDAKYGATFGGSGSQHAGLFSDAKSAWGVDGGYLWNLDDARSAGVEVGYMHFGDLNPDFDPMAFDSEQLSAKAMIVGGRFQVLFGDDKATIFQARAGWMSVKFDENSTSFDTDVPGIASFRQSGEYFGLGIGRQITKSVSLVLAYNWYNASDLNLNWIGLVAEYRF